MFPSSSEAQRYRTVLCLIHPRLPEIDQTYKLGYIHILDYYTAGRMNKLEQHTTAEVNPPKHKVEQKNPDTKKYQLYDLIYIKFKDRQINKLEEIEFR